jgi:hypothetical protein
VSRWKYKTATVTVDDNSVEVRQFTQNERAEFAATSKKTKDGELQAMDLPPMVIRYGTTLTPEEIAEMPPELADACVRKIMELSGLSDDDDAPAVDPEKKD